MADEDLDYLTGLAAEPEPEGEPAGAEPEPEDEPAGAEPEPEEEPAGAEPEPEEEPAGAGTGRKPQTASDRVRASRDQVRVEREARIRAEAERDALLKVRQAAPSPDHAEAARLRGEKMALMEPQERAIFLQNETIERMNQQLLIAELRSEDRADKAGYDARAVVDARYARNKDAVEARLRDFRAKGINATREQCLVQILGEKLLNEKAKPGARAAAGQRVAAAQGKPITAKGASSPVAGKGDDISALEARLKGKTFSSMFGN